MQLGAPPELIEMGLRIVADELKHAELSTLVYSAANGLGGPNLSRETLALVRLAHEPLELDVLRTCVEMFCLGETVAVRLFGRLRAGSSIPIVRQALERIQRDEVFHRDFGWTLLSWLLSTPMAPLFRSTLGAELPAMVLRLRRTYGGIALDRYGAEALERMGDAMSPETRAWGLMPICEYLNTVKETFVRDYQPRFSALNITLPTVELP